MQLLSQMLSKMTALLASLRLPLKKLLSYVLGFSLVALISCFIIDRAVSFYVQDRVYEDIETLPHRHYALVLGTSKYVAKGKTNKYYDYRLEASKRLIDQDKVDYLLLSGDNRTIQYNEPRTMFLDLRKMGVSESVMFKDFAGFRTLDSVVRANKVFQVPSFTIISQKFHCERALLIAKHYDIDANTYLHLLRALDLYDPSVGYTDVKKALSRIKACYTLVSVTTDQLFKSIDLHKSKQLLEQAGVDLRFYEFPSDYGHDAFLVDYTAFENKIRSGLEGEVE